MTDTQADDGRARAAADDEAARAADALAPRRGEPDTDPKTTRATATGAVPSTSKSAPFAWVFGDLGLKAVALVLAVTTWFLIRDQIQDDRTIVGVSVVLDDLPSSIRTSVTSLPRVSVRLKGTAGAVERARQSLEQAGHPVRVRLKDARGDSGPARFTEPSDFTFPFGDATVVESVTPAVYLDWYRVESQEVSVERPRINHPERTDIEDVTGTNDAELARVVVTGPVKVISELRRPGVTLVPDDVSADKWLRTNPDFATPFAWTSGFSRWRSQAPDVRAEGLLTIAPPTVAGKTKFRESKTTPVRVDLQILYPAGFDATAYEKYDVKIPDTGYDARNRRLDISVRGDPALITSLGAGHSGWTLIVQFPPPPKDDTESVTDFPAPVVLLPPDGAVGEAAPRLRLVSPPTVFVTLVKRKGQ